MMTKRRISKAIALLLLIGVVLNVAVAWACSLWLPVVTTRGRTDMTCNEIEGWAVRRWRTPGMEFVQSMHSTLLAPEPGKHGGIPVRGDPSALLPSHGTFDTDPLYKSRKRKSDDRAVATWGWPLLCMWCEYDLYGGKLMTVSKGIVTPIETPDYLDYYPGFRRQWPRAVPLQPLWHAFVLNSLFYAIVVWLLFVLPFALRRWRRIYRKLCPACGYPIGTSEVCTECGKPVVARGS